MVMQRIGTCLIGAMVLNHGLWCAGALAGETGRGDFSAPVYDAVSPSSLRQGLPDYRFIANHDWPAIRLFAQKPLDWSRFGTLALPVDNPGDRPFRLLLRIDDHAEANGDDRSLTGTLDIPPHARGTLILPLDSAPVGMVARPPGAGVAGPGDLLVRQVRGAVDLTHVTALHISGVRNESDQVLRLGNPMLRSADSTHRGAIADAFGQAISGQWPEKVADIADLRAKLLEADAQTRQLASGTYPVADRYGGVDPETELAGTGFFRVENTGGRWGLVTPTGHRFFSLGVDAVVASNPTIVSRRRSLFASLPESSDPLFRYGEMDAGGSLATFDFGAANLDRDLGPDWAAAWRERVTGRLKAWGFNTLGNWSGPKLTAMGALPFVVSDDAEGDVTTVSMPGGRRLPDPFDPRFAAVADALAIRMTKPHRDNPMLLGYFSGNELPWGSADIPQQGIAAQVLWLGGDSFAKRTLIGNLRRRYGSIASFATAWGVPAASSWEDLTQGHVPWPSPLTEAARRDIGDFQRLFATLYFSTVAQAIKRHDPHHLYLGTRFADAPFEVIEACARWCDVMSFNIYGKSPERRAAVWRAFGKPVLIGEFHFGSTDRGLFWPGMVEVAGEADRGPAYQAYVAKAVEDPQVVGAHWFQYADEPLTGRPYDGENGHIGLVAVTDVPYAGFVAAVAAANQQAMATFAGADRPDLRGTQ